MDEMFGIKWNGWGYNFMMDSILLFQIMSAIYSRSYLDWVAKASDEGWSVLTIATHRSHPKPIVMGPLQSMGGALRATCDGRVVDGRDFNHAVVGGDQVCHLFVCMFCGILVVCFVTSLLYVL